MCIIFSAAGGFLNRNEAVYILKEVLETADIVCPEAFSLDGTKDSTKVRIKTNERDRPILKEIAASFGLFVNEEKDSLVIS